MHKFLHLFLFAFSLYTQAQNLVPNPSFEDTIGCPTCENELYQTAPWYNPTMMSPDYFNTCSGGCPYPVGIPLNWRGYQNAKTGAGYTGIAVASPYQFTGREYIGVKLNDSLQIGIKYYISFYISLSDSARYATDDIGIYVSNDSVYDPNIWDTLPYVPQIINPTGNILTDKNNWVQISGEFIAQGGEEYIYLGNFNSKTNTSLISVPNGGDSIYDPNNNIVYYYVDDVCLSQNPDTCGITTNVQDNNWVSDFILYPNPVKNVLYINVNQNKNLRIEIINFLGDIIEQKELISYDTIDLSFYPTALYIARITDEKNTIVYKKIVLTK